MADTIFAREGKQLTFTVTFPYDVSARTPTLVARKAINDTATPLLDLTTTAGPNGGLDMAGAADGVVAVTITGPATKMLADTSPVAYWALWLDGGADDADEASGVIRTQEVVQP